jgi:von Willebrand factor type A domain
MTSDVKRSVRAARSACLAALICIFSGAPRAELPSHDEDGGFDLLVTFDYPSLIASGYLDVGGFTPERYCGILEKTSHHLWQTTEKQHWIQRVEFRLGTTESDINWFFVPKGSTSFGSFKNSVVLNENYGDDSSPLNNPAGDPGFDPAAAEAFADGLAWLLDHELGHFLYGLSDEYLHGRDSGANLGLCSGFVGGVCNMDASIPCVSDTVCDDANPGDTCTAPDKESCDEDSDCTGDETCIFQEKRTGEVGEPGKICNDHTEDAAPAAFTPCDDDADCDGLLDPAGNDAVCVDDEVLFLCAGMTDNVQVYCWTDADCQADGETGWCVREGQGGQPPTRRVCRDRNAPFPPTGPAPNEADEPGFRNRTSIMASSGGGGRWCDDVTHVQDRVILRGLGGDFDEDGTSGVDPDYALTLELGGGLYTAWDRAVRSDLPASDDGVAHPDLRSYFDARNGAYPLWSNLDPSDFESAVGFAAAFDCVWNIDEIPLPGANTVVLVDRSGSMDYEIGVSTLTKGAFEWAAEGALVLLEETDPANWVGLMAFSGGLGPDNAVVVQSFVERSTIAIPDDPFEAYFDGIEPDGNTDIGWAISAAVDEMGEQGPVGRRSIILMSDGANTSTEGPTYLEAAQAACDTGITVNTIAFGNADTSALKEIADLCEGHSVAAANEVLIPEGTDAHALKTEFVRMKHRVNGLDQVFEDELATLSETEDLQSRAFWVPIESGSLTFLWIGNEVPYCSDFGTEHCFEWSTTWDELVFTLESPSGQIYPGVIGKSFQAALRVDAPEPGWWQARVDASAVPVSYLELREATRVSWLAYVDQRDLLAKAWVEDWKVPKDEPVLINASLFFKAPLTRVAVAAAVSHNGVHYAPVFLFDDGMHGDAEPHDSIYGGLFNPDGALLTTPGAYSVKVAFLSLTGISETVRLEMLEEHLEQAPSPAPSVYAEAETLFHLTPLGCTAIVCPDPPPVDFPLGSISRGTTIPDVVIRVTGLALVPGRVGVDLGPGVHAQNVRIANRSADSAAVPAGDLIVDVVADVDARIGTHTLTVWTGSRKLTTEFDVTCSRLDAAPPIIEASRIEIESCSSAVVLPLPHVLDECSSGPVALTGSVIAINDRILEPPAPIAHDGRATLELGQALVRWEARDAQGNTARRDQRVIVTMSAGCSGAGRVPDGTVGGAAPLLMSKTPDGDIVLDWSESCAPGDIDYSVYAGRLGDFDSHMPLTCSTGGATEATVEADPVSTYYLVVPNTGFVEGSYGAGTSGDERAPSTAACLPRHVETCGR